MLANNLFRPRLARPGGKEIRIAAKWTFAAARSIPSWQERLPWEETSSESASKLGSRTMPHPPRGPPDRSCMVRFSEFSLDHRRPVWIETIWQDTAKKTANPTRPWDTLLGGGPMPVCLSPSLSAPCLSLSLSAGLFLFLTLVVTHCPPRFLAWLCLSLSFFGCLSVSLSVVRRRVATPFRLDRSICRGKRPHQNQSQSVAPENATHEPPRGTTQDTTR